MRLTPTSNRARSLPERAARAQDLLDARSALVFRFFAAVFERSLRSSFHALRMLGAPPPELRARKLVIYANHPSWWDAVVYVVIARRLLGDRAVYAPIDAAMLARYGFMARMGAYGVDQASLRGAADFLHIGRAALARGAPLIVAAQGRFADVRERPLKLRPGLAHLAEGEPDVCFLPLALESLFWNEKRPEMLLAFGPAIYGRDLLARPPRERLQMLENRLTATLDQLSAAAMTREARRFATLVSGAGGVDPLYDFWRRMKAAARGERFSPEHGAGE